jgi:hypothetical protein
LSRYESVSEPNGERELSGEIPSAARDLVLERLLSVLDREVHGLTADC